MYESELKLLDERYAESPGLLLQSFSQIDATWIGLMEWVRRKLLVPGADVGERRWTDGIQRGFFDSGCVPRRISSCSTERRVNADGPDRVWLSHEEI